ncbi:hypothetical protein EV200_102255 [Pedobacter psychrotolerans]|uniref:Uncharacterized protein n=1 Tax=Pedobacter psychrotolerans TaxID=1843235 RepID=A0A4R2HK82_9SPHI|nr:hypothetical protein EV200_102255 [Pedobacter psychrotolerans]
MKTKGEVMITPTGKVETKLDSFLIREALEFNSKAFFWFKIMVRIC